LRRPHSDPDYGSPLGDFYLISAASNICRRNIFNQREYPTEITFFLEKDTNGQGIPMDVDTIYIHNQYAYKPHDGTDIAYMTVKWNQNYIPKIENDQGFRKIVFQIPMRINSQE